MRIKTEKDAIVWFLYLPGENNRVFQREFFRLTLKSIRLRLGPLSSIASLPALEILWSITLIALNVRTVYLPKY